MRTKALILVCFLGFGALASAGDAPSVEVESAGPVIIPPSSPSLYEWFVGGTVGYLEELETEFYSLHVGMDMPYQIGGWDSAVYLEVGYAEQDFRFSRSTLPSAPIPGLPLPGIAAIPPVRVDIEIIPVTLNYKLERELSAALRAYLGIGAGVAFVDVSSSIGSDDDTTFYGQIFGGLLYEVSETVEVFGGVRWIYLDDVDLFGVSLDTDDDDVLFEGGIRINL